MEIRWLSKHSAFCFFPRLKMAAKQHTLNFIIQNPLLIPCKDIGVGLLGGGAWCEKANLIIGQEFDNLFEGIVMNTGTIMVSQVLKLIHSHRERSDSAETQYFGFSECERKATGKEEPGSKPIKLVKRQRDLKGRVLRLYSQLSTAHIYKFLGFVGINERALHDPSHDESFFSSYFHGRVVERVQVYDNAVLVELAAPEPSPYQMAIAQMIEVYKRKGCMKFYELATQIQQVLDIFAAMEGVQTPPDKSESLKKCLDSLGNAMFVCTSGVRKVAISKSLLAYLEYDIEEFCIQAVKFRGIFVELFSANCYFSGLMHLISFFKYTVQLANNQISLSQFKELTTFRFSDFIYSKSQVKSYCDMSLFLVNPSVLCHKIDFIYYQEKESCRPGEVRAIEQEKERVRQGEYQVIRKVKNIPSSLLTENQQLIAGYKAVREEKGEDSIDGGSSPL